MDGIKYGYARVSTDDQPLPCNSRPCRKPDAKRFSKTTAYREPRRNAQPCAAV
jgi:hypothetical protein